MLKQSTSILLTFCIHFLLIFFYSYFQDGLKTIDHFGNYVADLSVRLQKIRQAQDEEKRKLCDLKNLIKSTPSLEKEVSVTAIYTSTSLFNAVVF